MSVLGSPRIYFKGQISWDPIVTNNYADLYDENSGETVFTQATNKVKAFRDEAISRVPKGIWNPHGTHRSQFFNTEVTGYDLGAGLETADPFVSAAVGLTGMLVDLEPYGSYSSQIFFDAIQFGVEGGYGIFAPRTTRFTARYINLFRNTFNTITAGIASVVWQTSFSKSEGLRVQSFNSPVLQKLAASLKEEDVLGLTVRFNAYRTIYYARADLKNGSSTYQEAAADLQKKLRNGGFQPNPARSFLVGTLGLWRKGEPPHEPGDRSLNQVTKAVGTAHARVEGNRLILDLSNSVPEIDGNLTKMNLGDLTIVAVDRATNTSTTLGTIPYSQYDRAAYEASGGVVAVTLAKGMAELASTRDLQLRNASGTLLDELPLRAIPETPNVYLDEGETANATFQVYNRGLPFHSKFSLNLYKLGEDGAPGPAQPVQTDADGILTVPLTATAGSVTSYVPSFNDEDKPSVQQGINPLLNTYMYVRVRPADTEIAQLPPTWENVYARVLANWNAMAPCMDNWLKLDDLAQIQRFSPMLKMLTDPARFEDYRFMPVTRDMSAGQRALLYKFLDAAQPVLARCPIGTPTNINFTSLSRSMRRA